MKQTYEQPFLWKDICPSCGQWSEGITEVRDSKTHEVLSVACKECRKARA